MDQILKLYNAQSRICYFTWCVSKTDLLLICWDRPTVTLCNSVVVMSNTYMHLHPFLDTVAIQTAFVSTQSLPLRNFSCRIFRSRFQLMKSSFLCVQVCNHSSCFNTWMQHTRLTSSTSCLMLGALIGVIISVMDQILRVHFDANVLGSKAGNMPRTDSSTGLSQTMEDLMYLFSYLLLIW